MKNKISKFLLFATFSFVIALALLVACSQAEPKLSIYSPASNEIIYSSKLKSLQTSFSKGELQRQNFANNLVLVALSFVGSPYKAGTLDVSEVEALVIDLHNFDCVTFVETSLALTWSLQQDSSYQTFQRALQTLRYRNGQIAGYTSRLHYLSEWLLQGQANKFFVLQPGPSQFKKPIFMLSQSLHINKKQLADLPALEATEKQLSKVTLSGFTCQDLQNTELDSVLHDGDILGFVSNLEGLDFNHVGLAYKRGKDWTFINATSVGSKSVEVYGGTLLEYCQRVKVNSGVVIARAL